MPEGPEVKLTTEYLNSILENQIIYDWRFTSGQYYNRPPRGFDIFEKDFPVVVDYVDCKGKMIYFVCSTEDKTYYITHSMRMSGRWQKTEDSTCRWVVDLEDDELWFRNPRCLATLDFTDDKDEFDAILNSLGPDIMTDEFKIDVWKNIVKNHGNKNITALIMDQNIISGCGNYLKSEILHYAKISPLRKTHTLDEKEIENMYDALRIIPRLSYNDGGVSMKDFSNVNGVNGTYQTKLKAYGVKTMTKTKTSDGRFTYWDPSVQV